MDLRRLTRYILPWDAVPVDKRVDDAQFSREFFALPSRTARTPLDADRCAAASQGDTGIYYPLVRDGRYFRCTGRRAPGGALFCRLHLALARRRMAGGPIPLKERERRRTLWSRPKRTGGP